MRESVRNKHVNHITLDNLIRNNTNNPNQNTRNRITPNRGQGTVNKTNQSEVNLNAVREALKQIVLQPNNNNIMYPITKSQVAKYHRRARSDILKEPDFLHKALKVDATKKFDLSFKSMNISREMLAHLHSYVHVHQNIIKDWYTLKNLVNAINGEPSFPFVSVTHKGPFTFAETIRQLHNNYLFVLDYQNFRVSSKSGTVSIRYFPAANTNYDTERQNPITGRQYTDNPNRYIEWTYAPSAEIEAFIGELHVPQRPFDFKTQINLSNTNQNISATVIGMLVNEMNIPTVKRAMIAASYPPRFWMTSVLKDLAENNVAQFNNVGTNFSGSKLARIESFLKRIDDLFETSVRSTITNRELSRLIDVFAARPERFVLAAQKQVVNKLRAPLRRKENERQTLLSKNSFFDRDKQILAISTGVLDILALTTNMEPAIRELKGQDYGVVILLGRNPPNIYKNNLNTYVTKVDFTPATVAAGDLYRIVDSIVFFCLWYGTGLKTASGTPAKDLSIWLTSYLKARSNPQELHMYREFTTKKIRKLLDLTPQHFKGTLMTVLKEFCEINRNTDHKYEWFLKNYNFDMVSRAY